MTKLGLFHRGAHTLQVPMKLFALNRQRLCQKLSSLPDLPKNSFIVLQGGKEISRNDTDTNYPFRQESFFHWAFGVEEPDFLGAVCVQTGKSFLFIPKHPSSYAIWCGELHDPSYFVKKYEIDNVHYLQEVADVLKLNNAGHLLLLSGENSDSNLMAKPATFDGLNTFCTDFDVLHPVITELRVFKTDLELQVIRYVCKTTCDAHIQVMKACKPDLHEYQMESIFLNHCYFYGGSRFVAYCCIGASGQNCSILHYGHANAPNNKQIKNGDLCLFDMGAEYCGYASDVTNTFPANGKFTSDQKLIYEAVLDSNLTIQKHVKPGISWVDMHLLSQRVILEHLLRGGLLKGNVDEMMDANLGSVFMPHGLGHFMGVDVHDVGGYNGGLKRIDKPSLRNLRTVRILEPRMVITIEPGCYFIDHLLDAALNDSAHSKFLVETELRRFRGFGGVRIEDDILITDIGSENLSILPRTVAEIETIMART